MLNLEFNSVTGDMKSPHIFSLVNDPSLLLFYKTLSSSNELIKLRSRQSEYFDSFSPLHHSTATGIIGQPISTNNSKQEFVNDPSLSNNSPYLIPHPLLEKIDELTANYLSSIRNVYDEDYYQIIHINSTYQTNSNHKNDTSTSTLTSPPNNKITITTNSKTGSHHMHNDIATENLNVNNYLFTQCKIELDSLSSMERLVEELLWEEFNRKQTKQSLSLSTTNDKNKEKEKHQDSDSDSFNQNYNDDNYISTSHLLRQELLDSTSQNTKLANNQYHPHIDKGDGDKDDNNSRGKTLNQNPFNEADNDKLILTANYNESTKLKQKNAKGNSKPQTNVNIKHIRHSTLLSTLPLSQYPSSFSSSSSSSSSSSRYPLIVVGSLCDKLPNLTGIARTCEIFHLSEMWLPSKEIKNDPLFNKLSVSAAKWLPLRVVPPSELYGKLCEYRSLYGYVLIGLEQSTDSVSLRSYQFPSRSILLIGNEKKGIPIELLQIVDQTIEIPQEGIVRSLNVHVATSLVVWEYFNQNKFQTE